MLAVPTHILELYSTAQISGCRISRMEETFLGPFQLTPETAWKLGSMNVGVFAGGTPSLGRAIEKLKGLERPDKATWVLIAATKKMAAVIVQRWFQAETRRRVSAATLILPRCYANIVLCTPETLRRVEAEQRRTVAAIILIDMLCNIHNARGISKGTFHITNDRPQLVANFRNSLLCDGWAPPLIILTQKAAKSVWTDDVARAYCLDALWFVGGRELVCFNHGDSELAG